MVITAVGRVGAGREVAWSSLLELACLPASIRASRAEQVEWKRRHSCPPLV